MLGSEAEEEIDKGNMLDLNWGNLKGRRAGDDTQSFVLDGVKYCLYDCVYLKHGDESEENHIGKIISIIDQPNSERKVKIRWFFRPTQVQKWLSEREVTFVEQEIFLASGDGPGVVSINPVVRFRCLNFLFPFNLRVNLLFMI